MLYNSVDCKLLSKLTRMHSSKMRAARSSSHNGGSPHPPGQIPLNCPLGCGPGLDPPQFPPWLWTWTKSPSISPLAVGLDQISLNFPLAVGLETPLAPDRLKTCQRNAIFWVTRVLFVVPLIPMFWTPGDVCRGGKIPPMWEKRVVNFSRYR